jgi:GxxExxY protein
LMSADDAGQRAPVGDAEGGETENGGTGEQFLDVGGAAEEGEVRGGLELGVHALRVWSGFWERVGGWLVRLCLWRGSMHHGGRGVPGGRGEEDGLVVGDMTGRVIGLAIKVHKAIGPGLYENVYEDCLGLELSRAGLRFARQVELPLIYEGVRFERTYRADIIIEETIILEIKSIENILPIHEAQILTYLRLSGCHVGLLLNFNTVLLKNGLRRFIQSSSPRTPIAPLPP